MVKNNKSIIIFLVILLVIGISAFFALKNSNAVDKTTELVEKIVVQNSTCDYSNFIEQKLFLETKIKGLEQKNEYLIWKLNESSLKTEYIDFIKEQGTIDDLDTVITMNGFTGIKAEFNRPIYLLKSGTNFYQLCTSNSMSPAFDCKTTLVVYKPKLDELRLGDIIVFKGNEKEEVEPGVFRVQSASSDFVTHRIVKVDGDMLTTKGDNNSWSDDVRINKTKVVYKVWQ